jgi:hypothetical protein
MTSKGKFHFYVKFDMADGTKKQSAMFNVILKARTTITNLQVEIDRVREGVDSSGSAYRPVAAHCSPAVGIATGYGLDGSGFKPWGATDFLFSTHFRHVLGPTQPPVQRVPAFFL